MAVLPRGLLCHRPDRPRGRGHRTPSAGAVATTWREQRAASRLVSLRDYLEPTVALHPAQDDTSRLPDAEQRHQEPLEACEENSPGEGEVASIAHVECQSDEVGHDIDRQR